MEDIEYMAINKYKAKYGKITQNKIVTGSDVEVRDPLQILVFEDEDKYAYLISTNKSIISQLLFGCISNDVVDVELMVNRGIIVRISCRFPKRLLCLTKYPNCCVKLFKN